VPIVLAATPIGDVEDASPKLLRLIAEADLIAAEDTRRLLNLAGRAQVEPRGKVVAFHDHNEREKVSGLIKAAEKGELVLVVSDAGMPTISDPGFHLVKAAIEANVPITAVPGPSAVLDALALSGLPTDRFSFEGFPPRKEGVRRDRFHELRGQGRTMVFFESPRRLIETLGELALALGP
jgi:16S rRNA (cytidine1402-2'-O)-methyltransferase